MTFLVFVFIAFQAQSQNLKSVDYVEINDKVEMADPAPPSQGELFGPLDMNQPLAKAIQEARIHLLGWATRHDEKNLGEPYARLNHFGAWLNDPYDNTCYNTRGMVLQRDSQIPVQVSSQSHCKVESGLWNDPYTGNTIKLAAEIQIDHVVPLKNAYVSGGYRWTRAKRCHYANFLGNKYHLMAVSGFENMSKGDRSPHYYLPPKESYTCQYIKNWLKIKLIWGLNMSLDEAIGLREEIKVRGCQISRFYMSAKELASQRKFIKETTYQCRD